MRAEPNFVEYPTVYHRRYLTQIIDLAEKTHYVKHLSSSDVCDNETNFYYNETRVEQQYNHTSDNERPTIPKNMQGIQG